MNILENNAQIGAGMKQISLNGTWLMYRKDIGKQIQAQVPDPYFMT